MALDMEKINLMLSDIAMVCHEANRAYCKTSGDFSQPPWEEAPEWQKKSAMNGVALHISGDYGPEASHESWMKEKLNDGWVYGEEKNSELKTHPCLVPFDQLSTYQQGKDYLFRAIVHSYKQSLTKERL